VAEQRRALAAMDDAALEGALRDLGPALAYPPSASAGADIATRVRQRLVIAPPPRRRAGLLGWIGRRPVRRSVLVAIAAILVLAAIAGAVGLGLPGIRIVFGGPTPPAATATAKATPSPTRSGGSTAPVGSQPIGLTMGLGTAVSLEEAARIGGFDLVLPTDPAIGPPDAVYTLVNRVALVWSERPGLPADPDNGVGLVLSEFRGHVDDGYYQKTLDGSAQVTPVTVSGHPGYWISGPPHFFFYVDPSGKPVDDSHRIVGDTLIWADGDVTYRLESQLPMEQAIALAESLR
jgi:hypothetical protein